MAITSITGIALTGFRINEVSFEITLSHMILFLNNDNF